MSDTGSTALTLPIALAIIKTFVQAQKRSDQNEEEHNSILEDISTLSHQDQGFCKALLLACAHAANIGGTGLLTGCVINLMFREPYDS